MAAFERLADINLVTNLVKRGTSHFTIAEYYQSLHPNTRGISERSVRRYCHAHGITRLTNQEIEDVVGDLIMTYGHCYGRALMQGSVRSRLGVTYGAVSQRRISNALKRLAPEAFEARTRDILERTNPIPYYAPFFG